MEPTGSVLTETTTDLPELIDAETAAPDPQASPDVTAHSGEAPDQIAAPAEAAGRAAEEPAELPSHAVTAEPEEPAAPAVAAEEPADSVEAVSVEPAGLATEETHGDDEPEPTTIPIAEGPPPEAARPTFADLGLSDDVLRAIDELGYRHPTPIQEQAVPYVLMGRDVLGIAQTGTGKTAGFTLPMLDILTGRRARARMPRSLILEPTRELALQVAENFVQYGKYLKLTHALIIGGESMSDQKEVLNRGVDVLIATPGRLLDMFDRGTVLMSDTSILVIDEADRMLDMGFIPDVERIVSLLPANRQTLFFSATMGPEIKRLADAFLRNPKEVTVSRAASVATTITEGIALVAEHDKREALRRLIRTENVQNALIFCNRKVDVDILYKSLTKHQFSAGALHGDLSQTVRFSTLEKFKAGELKLLVCSDVAARGLDIGGLSHVFNFDVPIHAEDYVHRIGRTGRAGLQGHAFTIASPDDRYAVDQIEKLTGHPIPPFIVEGLDPVGWSEGGRKRRGRGGKPEPRKPAARKAASDAPKPREAKPRREAAPENDSVAPPAVARSERLSRRDSPRREGAAREEPRRAAPAREEPRRAAPAREEPRRAAPTREEPRRAAPAREEPRRASSAREETHREEPRWQEPRRDDGRRERYRRDEDLGPSVVGFGDDVPAFMMLRPRRPQPQDLSETDA
jgi:superfamily II DNA/RNA helicase